MSEKDNLHKYLDGLKETEAKLEIERNLALQKALQSDDVNAIFKAQEYLKQNKRVKGLHNRDEVPMKSVMVDPLELNSSLGFRNKSFSLSYDVLRAMGRTHVIKAIIETRKTQVSAYCQPQSDKYSTGFVIQPKRKFTQLNNDEEITDSQKKRIDELIEFLLNGGSVDNFWESEPFDVFVGKLVEDSLVLDQACAEVVRNNNGEPCEFKAVDSGTIRKIDSFADDFEKNHEKIKGYYPSLVQVLDGSIINQYYPWEMIWGVRNSSTNIRSNGYGRSELEDMIQTVTALLNSDYYNANFFKVGSAPKGILKYSGDINMNVIEQFKSQWVANTAGVLNMHKIPIMNADRMDFVNLQQSNKDMEFAKYQEFLIKIACALYKIDPSEIGFPMAGSSQQPTFGGSVGNAEKLKYSKDKGLRPLLKYVERWINRYLIWQLDPNYEFRFVGLDDSITYQEELDNIVKELQNFKTLNEVRKQMGLDEIEGGDIVLNSIMMQKYMADQQQAMMGGMGDESEEDLPQWEESDLDNEGDQESEEESESEEEHPLDDDENPFAKSLPEELLNLFTN